MIEILSNAALATIQDLGRTGAMRWGVGTAGAMDALALAAGNLLVGNEEGLAGLEVPVFPFKLRVKADALFALTGADCAATLDEVPVLPWSRLQAKAGQTLSFQLPVAGPWRSSRAYLCVAGGIDVPMALGSRSTQMRGSFGGLEGRALKQGDVLPVGAQPDRPWPPVAVVPPAVAMPRLVEGLPQIRVLPASEQAAFTPDSVAAFWAQPWKITGQSDRYGFRLAGEPLVPLQPLEMRSHGIVPGVIQVPASGQPIVQMRDAQPTGGYPKFGTVIEADLWRLAQAPVGSQVRFTCCTWDEATAALAENERWLAALRSQLARYQTNPLMKA